jgi:hypothetical protein
MMTPVTVSEHLTGPGVERGEERRRPMAHEVVGATLHLSRTHGQERRSTVHGLHLGLLFYAKHDRALGRVEIEATMFLTFSMKSGSVESMKDSER